MASECDCRGSVMPLLYAACIVLAYVYYFLVLGSVYGSTWLYLS